MYPPTLVLRACLLALLILATATPLLPAQSQQAPTASPGMEYEEHAGDSAGEQRRREGSRLAMSGYFLLTSDQITFCAIDESERLQTLENLALQRVAEIVRVSGGNRLTWQVEGTVTEYRGKNYLLIERAVVITQPDSSP